MTKGGNGYEKNFQKRKYWNFIDKKSGRLRRNYSEFFNPTLPSRGCPMNF